jgi:two-component system nitrogen regulation response regulator GlnG
MIRENRRSMGAGPNIGSTPVYVNGTQLPRDCSVRVALPAVVEIQDDTVLLVLRLPLAYPESHRLLEPHHPFGLVDRLGICGEGPRAWQLRLDIARAAVANKNVIAFGESGTGKELVARGIHALSHRARLPFVRVSFPDLPSGTAALRLNGGPANWPNPGTPRTLSPFEAGKGGVVFLDEIGEAPEEVQAILLTAFAGFYLYGTETTPRKVDSLLVAATNRPRSAIKFDVLHRIGTELDVPSLADRLEDLALVANHTLVEQVRGNTEYGGLLQTDATGRAWVEVEPDVIIQLLRAPPPGNIRQLEKKLGQLLAVSGGKGKLAWPDEWPRAAALPLDIRKELPHVAAVALMEGLGAQPTHAPPPVVESDQRPEIGRELLLQTLEETGWNIRATAAARGVSREKIYRLMEKYGLRRPE